MPGWRNLNTSFAFSLLQQNNFQLAALEVLVLYLTFFRLIRQFYGSYLSHFR